ncbi:mannitol operon repressor (mannitol repressor protein) [Aliivibrio wodanis]|uniref:Mannitol operon repressor (Mannitol repressor protein) n=1 Tax=Aliivibrio wodanis TaxID=80852 RepID=A0A090III9_9GAMM|nr:mannitol operon repressor (mannitol repressor protein) [Aliivibrio wodanis]
MTEVINESYIIERLDNAPSMRGFFIIAVDILNESIDGLIQRIFQKDNFAVQSVIGPLLQDSGPLGDLSVRLKLLFGLGVLPNKTYHDIEGIIQIRNALNSAMEDVQFTDPQIITPINKLNLITRMGMMQLEILPLNDDTDLIFYQMQVDRQKQMIRSGLSLAIVDICSELQKESPF